MTTFPTTSEALMASSLPIGSLVSISSVNGRDYFGWHGCGRVIDPATMHRPAQPGMVWVRETGLRMSSPPMVGEVEISRCSIDNG